MAPVSPKASRTASAASRQRINRETRVSPVAAPQPYALTALWLRPTKSGSADHL